MICETIERCRVCNSKDLNFILFLGNQPLANALKNTFDQHEEKYSLTLIFCSNCSLVQIKETVDKESLFKKYFWVTGTSSTAQRFAQDFYNYTQHIKKLQKNDIVIEIASNDGTFLKPFIENNLKAIGVDPAKNIADIANMNGIKTINAFWNKETANNIVSEYGKAKLIFARNVIPHASELHEVISSINLCLADDGLGIIEFHYAGNILEQLQYDSIYHEHLCYFSIKTIEYLLKQYNLKSFHIDLSPISGGAYIIYFAKEEKNLLSDNYKKLADKEKHLLINELSSWKSFAMRCGKHKQKSRQFVDAFSEKTIVGFGASARSSTYLNFCGFTSSDINAIIDNNKIKQELYTPGASIPIVPFEDGLALRPRLIFLLAWNFKDEIIKACREKGYRGNFLIPFPKEPYLI